MHLNKVQKSTNGGKLVSRTPKTHMFVHPKWVHSLKIWPYRMGAFTSKMMQDKYSPKSSRPYYTYQLQNLVQVHGFRLVLSTRSTVIDPFWSNKNKFWSGILF